MESKKSHIVWKSYDNQVSRTDTTSLFSLHVERSWGYTSILKTKLFSYRWNNKKDKIKREGLQQDIHKGGLRMVDIEIMFKALKLAWIPKLLSPGNPHWKTLPDYYFKRVGGLNFFIKMQL